MKQKLWNNWYWLLISLILLTEALVFIIAGENSYIGIHDNLDIHITDYQIMKLNKAFWSQGMEIPLLGGIDRNFLLSDLSLYSMLYMVFPTFTAYIIGYFLKIGIALFSGILLGKDILGIQYKKYEWIVVLGSFIYGLLPLYPAFSFSFASIPLYIYLIRCVQQKKGRRYYLFLFLYPLVSYFTFFGPFLLGYLLVYTIYDCIKKKHFNRELFLALVLTSLGYILVEYRLFLLIFTSGQPTIRETMFNGDDNALTILTNIISVFISSIFHAEDLHRYLVLPIVMLYFLYLNFLYIKRKQWEKAAKDPFNLILLFIIFNCVIYGIYTWEAFRSFVETLVPPLKGWQFNRTVFFNPFLWYVEIVIIAYRLVQASKKQLAILLLLAVLLVTIGKQSLYNDFYNTVYTHAYMLIKQKDTESLSYREFFSEDLFRLIQDDINYQGEYSVAYGFHPAVLSYNGIATLDGCLSHYYQSYKEAFRKVIEPALEQSEVARSYYDDWGGRAYIFSGTDESIWQPVKTMKVTDYNLSIDTKAFKDLGGKYIFSRIELANASELNLMPVGEYTHHTSPYTIWVYKAQ